MRAHWDFSDLILDTNSVLHYYFYVKNVTRLHQGRIRTLKTEGGHGLDAPFMAAKDGAIELSNPQ